MNKAEGMKNYITDLAQKHGVDLSLPGAELCLEMEGFDPLYIKNVGKNYISVVRPNQADSDKVFSPEVTFFTGHSEWMPVRIEDTVSGLRLYDQLAEDQSPTEPVTPEGEFDPATFCRSWACILEGQGWLENATRRE